MQVVSFLSVSPCFLTAASRPLSLFVPPVLPSPELIRKMDPEISFSAESTGGHVRLHWGLGRPRRMNWCRCLEARVHRGAGRCGCGGRRGAVREARGWAVSSRTWLEGPLLLGDGLSSAEADFTEAACVRRERPGKRLAAQHPEPLKGTGGGTTWNVSLGHRVGAVKELNSSSGLEVTPSRSANEQSVLYRVCQVPLARVHLVLAAQPSC